MDITAFARQRYTTKAYDPSRTIPADQVAQLEELLRINPSSVNSQPWHYLIASTAEGKARVAKATSGRFEFNLPKVVDASLVVVFCTRTAITDDYLQALLEQEARDGRFANEEAKAGQHRGRSYFVNLHRYQQRDAQQWMEKQVYLSAGSLLLGAASLGIDATPIEGFDQALLDAEFDLHAQGLMSTVIVSLGYRRQDDFNAALPKSRWPADQVITRL